jgi:integrase-like protein
VDLRWDQIDFDTANLAVRRVKSGSPSTHPSRGDELRALRRLNREQEPKSPFVFTSERGSPFTTAGFARMVERAGMAAELGFKATHTCCVMPADSPWPMRGMIRGLFRPTYTTRTFNTRCAIPNWHRIVSRTSGGAKSSIWLTRSQNSRLIRANHATTIPYFDGRMSARERSRRVHGQSFC